MIQIQTTKTLPAQMIGAHIGRAQRPHKPLGRQRKTYDDGMALTRGQCAIVARCLGELGRLGFIQGDGFTVEMAKAGPYRELLAIFAHAGA